MVSPLSIKPKELPQSLPFADSNALKNGAHLEAFFNFQDICLGLMDDIRARTGRLNILDFGSGRYGVGRAVMETKMNRGEELALYDLSPISSPIRPDIAHIVGEREALSYTNGRFNMVNLSYVLCHLNRDEAGAILSELALAHPYAQFLVTDYVLKDREELLSLLDSAEENKWKTRQGYEEFARMHTSLDTQMMRSMLMNSGFEDPNDKAWYLDKAHIRASMIAEPEIFLSY